jgi:penicillin V acylase-like amidase (Ntn superfamily)
MISPAFAIQQKVRTAMRTLVAAALFSLLPSYLLVGPTWACTSFCLDTADGPVFAANLDLFIPGDGHVFVNRRGIAKENTREGTTGKTTKWISKYGSVTFNLAGHEFAWSGMNEAGLVISGMELKASEYPEPDKRPPFDGGYWTQYILDTCGSVREAIQAASRVRLVCDGDSAPSHFLIADAEGDCAALEYLDGRLVVYAGEDLPVKAMSNMSYARALAAYKRGGPRWWWSNPGRSAERFAGAADRMKSYDVGRHPSAMSYALETLAYGVSMPNTKWSVVYDIAKREVWFGSVVSPTVKRLSLQAFDLSCEVPLLMLDVNAAPEGNVERFFTPYDHDVNLRVFRTLCARQGIDISAENAEELMRLLESFACAR